MRSVSMSTNRSGLKPFMRLAISPRLSTMMVVGMEVIRSIRDRPSSKYTALFH